MPGIDYKQHYIFVMSFPSKNKRLIDFKESDLFFAKLTATKLFIKTIPM